MRWNPSSGIRNHLPIAEPLTDDGVRWREEHRQAVYVITTGADVMNKIFTHSAAVRDSQLISALTIDIIYLNER